MQDTNVTAQTLRRPSSSREKRKREETRAEREREREREARVFSYSIHLENAKVLGFEVGTQLISLFNTWEGKPSCPFPFVVSVSRKYLPVDWKCRKHMLRIYHSRHTYSWYWLCSASRKRKGRIEVARAFQHCIGIQDRPCLLHAIGTIGF